MLNMSQGTIKQCQATTGGVMHTGELWLADWLVGWLFNGTSTQKGQFVPTSGEGNRLSQDGQRDTMHITLRYTITM